jgi:hypothetical protein
LKLQDAVAAWGDKVRGRSAQPFADREGINVGDRAAFSRLHFGHVGENRQVA